MMTSITSPLKRYMLPLALVLSLSACIVTPRIEMVERIDFDYHPPAIAQPMDAVDLMCCTECQA